LTQPWKQVSNKNVAYLPEIHKHGNKIDSYGIHPDYSEKKRPSEITFNFNDPVEKRKQKETEAASNENK
jgi:hypothetical protein